MSAADASREALLRELRSRRELRERLASELEGAARRLDRVVAASGAPGAVASPFGGPLDWPARGRITVRFGKRPGRYGTAVAHNGISIAARYDTPVRAVEAGRVAYAAPFSGFGRVVILDHGDRRFSLYGYLSTMIVTPGTEVSRGATLGTVGRGPDGDPTLYFELRVDGRPVDPLQWLKRQTPDIAPRQLSP